MRGKNAWLRLAVRLRTWRSAIGPAVYLAPFGGITRIRFKGFVQDVSAVSAPPLCWKVRRMREEVKGKSSNGRIPPRLPFLILNSSFLLYFAASAFMLVWKMAIQTLFSIFQTVPQL